MALMWPPTSTTSKYSSLEATSTRAPPTHLPADGGGQGVDAVRQEIGSA